MIKKIVTKVVNKGKTLASNINYVRRRGQHKKRLPAIHAADRWILESLERDGVAVIPLETLGLVSTPSLMDAAYKLLPKIENVSPSRDKPYEMHASTNQILEYPNLIQWGLEERLLDIVENYLGVPVSYKGLTFRRDLADGRNMGTRLWHKDDEDHRIVKIIVYLNDVTSEGGPFECIPKPHAYRKRFMRMTDGRLSDADMERTVPISLWKSCTGPAGTVVFVDTCNVYHRGKMPTKGDRYTMFFCYNSTIPKHPEYCVQLFPKEKMLSHARNLSSRQQEVMV